MNDRIQVVPIRTKSESEWDAYVAASPAGTLFHTYSWLSSVQDAYGYKLQRIGIYKGDTLTAVFPYFIVRRLGLVAVTSPPPKTAIPLLGPLWIGCSSAPRRVQETGWLEVAEAVASYVCGQTRFDSLNMRAALPFGAVRGFQWKGHRVTPSFTYVVPLSEDLSALRVGVSSGIRRSISRCKRDVLEFGLCSDEDVELIYRKIADRYQQQGMAAPFTRTYLQLLWSRVDRSKLFGLKLSRGKEFINGMLCTAFNGTISFWSGLPRSNLDGIYVNDFFHWNVIVWAKERGLHSYDMVGAGTPQIARYKAKFGPRVEVNYQVTADNWKGRLARMFYHRFVR